MNNLEIDSEILNISEFKKNSKNGDLFNVASNLYDDMKLKIAGFLFVFFIILNTDIFAENVLSKFISGTYDVNCDKLTEKGIVISGIVLSIAYLFLDFLYESDII